MSSRILQYFEKAEKLILMLIIVLQFKCQVDKNLVFFTIYFVK